MIKKNILSTFLLILLCNFLNAQVSVSYYQSINFSKAAIGYEFSPRLWADLRMYGGLRVQDFTIEPTISYNLVAKENHDIYAGAGFAINYVTGPVFPIGVRIRPFQLKSFSFHIEALPGYRLEGETAFFDVAAGLRYSFHKK